MSQSNMIRHHRMAEIFMRQLLANVEQALNTGDHSIKVKRKYFHKKSHLVNPDTLILYF